MNDATNQGPTHEMIFTAGLPGSGKSTTLRRLGLLNTHTTIDPDSIKETHEDYDPKNPQALHAWSKEISEIQFQSACDEGTGRYIIDGTGTNAEKMIRRMRQAKAAGFMVRLILVEVSLETAIARNAARTRTVPAHVVIEKARDIKVSMELCKSEADVFVVVNND